MKNQKKKHQTKRRHIRQEKNRLSWAKEKLGELLPGVEAELPPLASTSTSTSGGGRGGGGAKVVRVASVSSVDGDAYQSTRKGGKKISAYDLKLELRWEVVEAPGGGGGGGGGGEGDDGDGGGGENGSGKGSSKGKVIAGDLKVLELATGHDEDDLIFEASTSHKGFEAKEAAEALKAPLMKALSVFVAELEALEL